MFAVAVMLCSLAGTVYAQDISITFNRLSEEEGLPGSENYFIYQDAFGFVWIGAGEGLFRFDGLELKLIPLVEPGAYLPDVSVQVTSRCFEDPAKNLWFSTTTAIMCYRRAAGRVEVFRAPGPDLREICAFHLDAEGYLWVKAGSAAQSALYVFDTQFKQLYERRGPLQGGRFAVLADEHGRVKQVVATMLSEQFGLNLVNAADSTEEIRHFEFTRRQDGAYRRSSAAHNAWASGDTVVWVGIYNGLGKFYPKKDSAVAVVNQALPDFGDAYGLVPYDKNRLLVATDDGLLVFDMERNRFVQQFRHQPNIPGSIPSGEISALYRDPSGGLWLSGPRMGIAFAHLRKNKFPCLAATAGLSVSALFEDRKGRIWCSSQDSGVYVFKQDGKELFHSTTLINHSITNRLFPVPPISVFWEDSLSGIWGLYGGQALHWNEASCKFEFWEENLLWVPKTAADVCSANCRLADGTFLVARGKDVFQLETGWRKISLLPWPGLNVLHLQQATAIFQSRKGCLYLADNNDRILALEPDSKITELAGAGTCTSLAETEDGCVWAAGSKGLFRIDTNLAGRLLTEKADNVPNVQYNNILSDKKGGLWLAGYKGLSYYYPGPSGNKFHRFQTADGLLSLAFSPNAMLRSSAGDFWAGGKNGVNVFRPEDIHLVSTLPKIQITNLKVNDLDRATDPWIGECRALEFPFSENTLTLEFVALEYSDPANNRMAYRLKGHDREWLETPPGVRGFARYARLAPGSYTFQIKAANSDGVWTPEPKTLRIVIRPPFWQRLWFKAAIGLLFALSIWGATRLYIRRQLAKQRALLEKQEALQAERNRIAGELHDDIGQGLSRIKAISEAAKQWNIPEDNRRQLDKIWTSSMELIEKMGDIIWAVDGGNDTLENLLYAIRAYVSEFLETHRITASLYLPETIPAIEMSGARRRNILLVIKECIHNIVKHSGATAVEMRIAVNEHLTIQILDNGHGFVEKVTGHGGHGLRNMQKRARAVNGNLEITNTTQGVAVVFFLPLAGAQ